MLCAGRLVGVTQQLVERGRIVADAARWNRDAGAALRRQDHGHAAAMRLEHGGPGHCSAHSICGQALQDGRL